ncbi:VIT1/CCC1 transporter family protein [Pseudoxanthomonas mexicana]|jgi:VIT1/CCC1 family predicted Fe2+/Mn2+ transporter|uniref:VIT family protein n=1 Tax=Pseudoxanthomonas mexicana TaxID=128785 RepID=A0ABX6R8C7_PSEMX|nr:VIT family protein [Pseudoxanthomonas mexicana]MBP6457544.1 VIT family protein [Pseudoxanthomonas sp.]MBP9646153.1 VIT family protein [Pseudoxanthomonas sp.]MCP1582209.1 VIT1/CCC1 family predicted Fe2+/Mn2+ transporter [Pseudoxanthomonas mexicana]QLQ27489.1 MAG: VIT family protein [Pseudoxanthomonas sp.]QND79508.1 VIT family protein [Pseudoxanthomonas mexicana]
MPRHPRTPVTRHRELHRTDRVGWLRAAVLGANDGIVSVAGLVVGVAASGATPSTILLTGVAGLVAGAMSMAAGEYVSVQSQADAEAAALALEKSELRDMPDSELAELTQIYVGRGLEPALARQVAEQLTARDALTAHMRDELGITEELRARPVQAALASAAAFTVGALLPIATTVLAPAGKVAMVTTAATLVGLLLSGGLAARVGGAPVLRGAWRVGFWGAMAMGAAALVGRLFHVSI